MSKKCDSLQWEFVEAEKSVEILECDLANLSRELRRAEETVEALSLASGILENALDDAKARLKAVKGGR